MTDYSHLTDKDYINLLDWVDNSTSLSEEQIKNILNLNIKYTKPIRVYRGMSINSNYLDKLLNDKMFKLKQKFSLISWTKNFAVANNFSKSLSIGNKFGIIIKTILKPNEIIIDFTDKKLIDNLEKSFIKRKFLNTMVFLNHEKEVLAKYNPNTQYGLCKNIIIIKTYNENLSDNHIDLISKKMNSNNSTWSNYRTSIFKCNKKGILSVNKQ